MTVSFIVGGYMSTDKPLKGGDRLIATDSVICDNLQVPGFATIYSAEPGDELIVCRVMLGRIEVVKTTHPLLRFDIFEGQYKRKE